MAEIGQTLEGGVVKVKVADLSGQALDWAVALSIGYSDWDGECFCTDPSGYPTGFFMTSFCPSADWSQGGPIIERENITVIRVSNDYIDGEFVPKWFAETDYCVGHSAVESYEHQQIDPAFIISADDGMYGPTPLVAAMRCFVASKLGDELEIPDELC